MEPIPRPIEPAVAERAAVDAVLGADDGRRDVAPPRGGHDRATWRSLLLPTLHAVNDRVGWISPTAIDYVADRIGVSPAEIYGVATFYGLFATTERPARQVHVCVDVACRSHPDRFDPPPGTHPSACLGLCDRAPAAFLTHAGDPVSRTAVAPIDTGLAGALAGGRRPGDEPDPAAAVPQAGDPSLVLLRRAGRSHPLDLDAYLADGGFEAWRIARELGPDGVIPAVADSGLTGRGGAGFPTARKWAAVRSQDATARYLIANADESEPGTFKDRTLIENDPYALVESMLIAALATSSSNGIVYLRGEYARAEATLSTALVRCRERGLLGTDAGSTIDIVRGAGAYICGEETAIFNSVEGYRGEPRNKPPFPHESGLFGLPTAVNNVETLMNVPPVLRSPYRADRRLFCLSGAVVRPGVYEVGIGTSLGDLIELAGGVRAGSQLQAIMLGGAAGGFAGPDDLDLPLDDASARQRGLTLGSGVVLVHDQSVDLVDQLHRIAAFFSDESCGQCVPCRVGTVRQQEALAAGDVELVHEIGAAMRDASICGLGQTAANAVESAIVRLGVRP